MKHRTSSGRVWMRGWLLSILACAVSAGVENSFPTTARADDFVDTRLTFTFGDDDVLSDSDERIPLSPDPSIGDRPGYELFFENLNTRFTDRENIAHLVAYREMPGFAEHVTTEAAVVARLELESMELSDTGSYIRIRYNPWSSAPEDGLALVLFPLDSDRVRLGYLYDLTYGGSDFVPRRSMLRSPGAKLSFRRGVGEYFVGVKTVPTTQDVSIEVETGEADGDTKAVLLEETQYAVLGGVAFDLFDDRLRLDVGAGYFQQGTLENSADEHVDLRSFGGSARILYHHNLPILESIDLQLYRNDPNLPFVAFREETYIPGELGFLVSLEGEAILQRLADVDVFDEAKTERGLAGALITRVQYGYWRFELTALYRDLSYLLKNSPSYLPFFSIPDEASTDTELFFALTADYHFPGPHLTTGVSGGVQFPASITTEIPLSFGGTRQTIVVRDDGRLSVIDDDEDVQPVIATNIYARLDVSEMLYARAWVQYVHDENTSEISIGGSNPRVESQRKDQLGFGVSVAARY